MKKESSKLPIRDSDNLIVTGKSGNRRIFFWGVLSTLFFVVLFTLNPTLLQRLDFINYDRLLRNFPNNHANSRLVIVDLDEKSLNQYGQWPWPRYRVAELFKKIAAMKPNVIGVDMFFAEPDRTSAGQLLKELRNAYKINIDIDWLPHELSDNDLILAKTLDRGHFILGNKFQFNRLEKNSEQCLLHPVKVSFMQNKGERKEKTRLPESTGVLCNLNILSEKAGASGFLNFSPDKDGMLRRMPMLIQYNGEVYSGLGLATVLKLKKTNNIILQKNGSTLQSIRYKGTSVPVDLHGQLLIKFRGAKKSYDYISAADIMNGNVSSERLQGRIAFVGTSSAGLSDFLTTPFDPIFPGVEVHATVVDNLLTGDFITIPSWSNGLVLLLILGFGVSLSLLITFRSAASGFIIMLLFIVGLWLTTQQTFFRMGLFVGTAFPIAAVVCN